jgi:hypothetical protein
MYPVGVYISHLLTPCYYTEVALDNNVGHLAAGWRRQCLRTWHIYNINASTTYFMAELVRYDG